MIFGDFLTIFACKIFNIDVESTKVVLKIQTTLREEIFAGINFRKFFSDISRELIFANWAQLRISREFIFAN